MLSALSNRFRDEGAEIHILFHLIRRTKLDALLAPAHPAGP